MELTIREVVFPRKWGRASWRFGRFGTDEITPANRIRWFQANLKPF